MIPVMVIEQSVTNFPWISGYPEEQHLNEYFTLDIHIVFVPWYAGQGRPWSKTKLFQVHILRFVHLYLLIKKCHPSSTTTFTNKPNSKVTAGK